MHMHTNKVDAVDEGSDIFDILQIAAATSQTYITDYIM